MLSRTPERSTRYQSPKVVEGRGELPHGGQTSQHLTAPSSASGPSARRSLPGSPSLGTPQPPRWWGQPGGPGAGSYNPASSKAFCEGVKPTPCCYPTPPGVSSLLFPVSLACVLPVFPGPRGRLCLLTIGKEGGQGSGLHRWHLRPCQLGLRTEKGPGSALAPDRHIWKQHRGDPAAATGRSVSPCLQTLASCHRMCYCKHDRHICRGRKDRARGPGQGPCQQRSAKLRLGGEGDSKQGWMEASELEVHTGQRGRGTGDRTAPEGTEGAPRTWAWHSVTSQEEN